MDVGFTGTREGITPAQNNNLIAWLSSHTRGTFRHGDCVGADKAAHDAAMLFGWYVHVHPGPDSRFRAHVTGYNVLHPVMPNLERNAAIVNAADILLACPSGPETLRSGTWSTIRKARKRGILVTLFWPDGSISDGPVSLTIPAVAHG